MTERKKAHTQSTGCVYSRLILKLVNCLCLSTLLTAASAEAEFVDYWFSDGEFHDADWQVSTFADPGLGSSYSSTASRRDSDGDPGAYRWIYMYVEGPVGLPVLLFNRKLRATISPALSNGINSISYWESARLDSGGTVAQITGLALAQQDSNNIERVYVAGNFLTSESTWTERSLSNLTADQFAYVDNGGFDATRKPDFSSRGKPITLGFFRLVSSSNSTVSFPAGIDNWKVKIESGTRSDWRSPCAACDPDETFLRGCALELLACYWANCITSSQSISASTTTETAMLFLRTYRAVRDQLLAPTLEGQRYIRLFESHNAEMISLFGANPTLVETARTTLQAIMPTLDALLQGRGASALLTAEQVTALDTLMDGLSVQGSQELRDAIAAERAKWGPLENFIGRSAIEVQNSLLGHAVYLPRVINQTQK